MLILLLYSSCRGVCLVLLTCLLPERLVVGTDASRGGVALCLTGLPGPRGHVHHLITTVLAAVSCDLDAFARIPVLVGLNHTLLSAWLRRRECSLCQVHGGGQGGGGAGHRGCSMVDRWGVGLRSTPCQVTNQLFTKGGAACGWGTVDVCTPG